MTTHHLPAVVTAAGAATRFRPFSIVVPKEMLPIGDRPAVHHVIAECLRAGADHVHVVTRPGDSTVPAYVEQLRVDGLPVSITPEDLSHGYGNAAPLLTLAPVLGTTGLFAVAFGDDIVLGGTDLADMTTIAARSGADAVIAAQRVGHDEISGFGVVDTDPDDPDRVLNIRQRPDPATVTEPLAVVSRLLLRPTILDLLNPTDRAGGEIDLGAAVDELARVAHVRVHRLEGQWVTVGTPRQYFAALRHFWQQYDQPPTRTGAHPC